MSFNKELEAAKTIREVFEVVNKHYNTDESLSFVKSLTIKKGLIEAIKLIKPNLR